MFDVIYGVEKMLTWVPALLWWALFALGVGSLILAGVRLRWRLVVYFIRAVDRINEWTGQIASWLILVIVLVTFASVVLRYVFAMGWIWVGDLIQWPHGAAFMLAAGYTLLHEEHVRVDIIYAKSSDTKKAWTDILGALIFLLPWIALVAWVMLPAVSFSWKFTESSLNAGGLPGRYLFKSTTLFFCVLLCAQGLAMAGRRALLLVGLSELIEDSGHRSAQV